MLVAVPGMVVRLFPRGMVVSVTFWLPLVVVTLDTGEGVVSPPWVRKVTTY